MVKRLPNAKPPHRMPKIRKNLIRGPGTLDVFGIEGVSGLRRRSLADRKVGMTSTEKKTSQGILFHLTVRVPSCQLVWTGKMKRWLRNRSQKQHLLVEEGGL